MKPDKEKELEELMEQQKNRKDHFGSIYGDLFGGNDAPAAPEMPEFSDDPVKGTEKLADFLDKYKKTDEEEALKHAEDALKEARVMLTDLTSDLLGSIGMDSGKNKASGGKPGTGKTKDQKDALPREEGAKDNKEPAPLVLPEKKNEPETDPMEELDNLIGLTTIKKDVKELADFVTIQKMRKDQGMKSVPLSLHLVFTGNPGTGKTTVARILSKIYKKIGVLSKGQLVEVDRSGLVAGYVGQTALKTQDRIKEAMGGILFIDEAYALAQKDDAFGQEAIDTILKAMEDHRDDLVVIVAGYTGPMEKFINSNPGLKSRFNKYIEFPDYTLEELEAIFYLSCKKYDYHPDEAARRQIHELLKLRMLQKKENFANAREARNLFEDIITNQARRVALIKNPTYEELTTILVEDLYESQDASSKTGSRKNEESSLEKKTPECPAGGKAEPAAADENPADGDKA